MVRKTLFEQQLQRAGLNKNMLHVISNETLMHPKFGKQKKQTKTFYILIYTKFIKFTKFNLLCIHRVCLDVCSWTYYAQ